MKSFIYYIEIVNRLTSIRTSIRFWQNVIFCLLFIDFWNIVAQDTAGGSMAGSSQFPFDPSQQGNE